MLSATVEDTMNLHYDQHLGSVHGSPPTATIRQKDVGQLFLPLNVRDITRTQELAGVLKMNVGDVMDSQSVSIPFKFSLSPALFLRPVKLSPEEFADIVADSSLTQSAPKVLLKIPTTVPGIQKALQIICNTLRLKVVEIVENSASLFGKSIQDHPVCGLAKALSDNELTLELKSSNAELAASLATEAKKLFQA